MFSPAHFSRILFANRDPLPLPPAQEDGPRTSERERRRVRPGEAVILEIDGFRTVECTVDISYPSGFAESVPWAHWRRFMADNLLYDCAPVRPGVLPIDRLDALEQFLLDYRRCSFFPNEFLLRNVAAPQSSPLVSPEVPGASVLE